MRLLLLGGSSEASALAAALGRDRRFDPVLSLAGRTRAPRAQPVPVRTGGFGGATGLARFLREERIHALVDATHPFASQMSRNAIAAATVADVPLLAVERPAWTKGHGDIWIEAASVADAVQAIGQEPRVVFSGIGALSLEAFEAAPQHRYFARIIDRPERRFALPSLTLIEAQGPFTAASDIALFRQHGIELVLAKNSGGEGTVSKIEAARALRLPVIMIRRPAIPPRPAVVTEKEALLWLLGHHGRLTERGV